MNRLQKNGILLVLALCALTLPVMTFALEPDEEGGQTAGQRLEETRQIDLEEEQCRTAVDNSQNLVPTEGGRSGDYVPVHEVGDLLDVNWRNAGLTFQICMYTKTLKRIQYEWEEKELITNPDARKASAKAIGELRKDYFYGENADKPAMEQKQFYTSQEEETTQKGQPIYITNTTQHIQGVTNEAEGLFLYDLNEKANREPIFTQSIKSAITQDSAVNQSDAVRLAQRLKSDFTSEQEFTDFTSDFNKGGWDAWLKIIQPNNNPYGQYMIAQEELGLRKSQAEQNAREEVLAGGGFLPNRVCELWDSLPSTGTTGQKQFCRKWKVLTPATAQVNQYNQLWGATLDQVINADQQIEDFIAPELVNDGLSLVQGIGANTTRTSIFDPTETDPCPGPGPCVDTGWTGASSLTTGGGGGFDPPGNNLTDSDDDGIYDYLSNNRGLYDGLGGLIDQLRGDLGLTTQQRRAALDAFLATVPPTITMNATTPSLQEINTVPNQSRITWDTFNATRCEVANDWYHYGTRNANDYWEGSYTIKEKGDRLSPTGNNRAVTIELPVRFPVDFVNTQSGNPLVVPPTNQNLRATRGMLQGSVDTSRLAETITINTSNVQGFVENQAHDLLIGGLDGRWEQTGSGPGRPTGERPALHVPATTNPNVCTRAEWYGSSKLVASLRNEALRRIGLASDPAEVVLRYFNISYNPLDVCRRTPPSTQDNSGWDNASIVITPKLTYGMICYNNNTSNSSNYAYKEVTITR